MKTLKDKELQDTEGLDNAANFGGIGDNVQFNPLATGGAQDITTGGDYIDRQLLSQKKRVYCCKYRCRYTSLSSRFWSCTTNQTLNVYFFVFSITIFI